MCSSINRSEGTATKTSCSDCKITHFTFRIEKKPGEMQLRDRKCQPYIIDKLDSSRIICIKSNFLLLSYNLRVCDLSMNEQWHASKSEQSKDEIKLSFHALVPTRAISAKTGITF